MNSFVQTKPLKERHFFFGLHLFSPLFGKREVSTQEERNETCWSHYICPGRRSLFFWYRYPVSTETERHKRGMRRRAVPGYCSRKDIPEQRNNTGSGPSVTTVMNQSQHKEGKNKYWSSLIDRCLLCALGRMCAQVIFELNQQTNDPIHYFWLGLTEYKESGWLSFEQLIFNASL